MNWDYSRHYARFHPDTPEHDANLRAIMERWLGPFLPADRTTAVLDVGCGRGYALQWLRDIGYGQVRGIDLDSSQVEFARARGLEVECTADSAAFLRSRPGAAGLVLLMDVLEHLERGDDRALLEGIHAALKPGGRLLVSVPNALSPLSGYWRYIDYTHRTTFTPDSLEYLLGHAGFEVETLRPLEIVAAPHRLLPIKPLLRWLLLKLGRAQPRIACLGEFGWRAGWAVPLAPNLLAVCGRR